MMRIKGRYVALIAIDIDREHKDGMRPAGDIVDAIMSDEMTDAVRDLLFDISDGNCQVSVTKLYAEAHVEEDADETD